MERRQVVAARARYGTATRPVLMDFVGATVWRSYTSKARIICKYTAKRLPATRAQLPLTLVFSHGDATRNFCKIRVLFYNTSSLWLFFPALAIVQPAACIDGRCCHNERVPRARADNIK